MNETTRRLTILLLAVFVMALSSTAGDAAATTVAPKTRLAGPWYTPQELRALRTYAGAPFAQKQALLAGADAVSDGGGFHWGDAGVGAGAALGAVLVAGGSALLLVRTRADRRRLRHS